jgi:hypothetical protein
MSAERHHEHEARHEQQHAKLAHEREQRLEALRAERHEQSTETAENRAEHAREVIHHHEQPEPSHHEHEAAPRPHTAHLLNHKLNYRQTLASVQRKLRPVSRSFSKFIHQPAVERASDAVGKTVARPSVSAGATWTALIVGIVFYFTARRYGYTLSGSELIIAFVVGAILGLLLEGAFRVARRR